MHYDGLDEADLKINELLASVKRFLVTFERSSNKAIYEPNELVSLVDTLKTSLYSCGVGSFVDTFSPGKQGLTGDGEEKIKPLVAKWKNLRSGVDEQVHQDFMHDLAEFSLKYPELFTDNDQYISMLQVYKKYLWDKVFGKYESTLNGYLHRLSAIVGAMQSQYEFYVNTRFVTLSPYEFEQLISDLFVAKSYHSYVTNRSGDFGVDVIADNGIEKIAIQVKKYSDGNNVGNVDVQKILGGMSYKDYKADKAILITTSNFSKKALEQAEGNPIELWNLSKLKQEIVAHLCHQNPNAESILQIGSIFHEAR